MVDYKFYVNQYAGNRIPETDFPPAVARATDALDRMKRIYRIESAVGDEEAMAVCAMAEAVYDGERRRGVSAASVGSVSVRYETGPAALGRELYRCAQRYLTIYRGVAQ